MAVGLLWIVAAFRIQSYVTGQDGVTYLRLARTLIEEPVGSAAFREALTEYAPGYPLILAAAIRVGGRFAPHWVNLGFALGLLAVYAGVMRRLDRDALVGALALVVLSAVLLAGFAMNPHFLLYPFRGMPAYFFCWLGYFLLLAAAGGAARPGCMVGSSLAFLAAIAVREPMVFGLAGGFLWLATQPRSRAKRTNLAAFLVPWVAVALLLGAGLAVRGQWGTDQFSGWLYLVRQTTQGGLGRHVGGMLAKLGSMLADELTWGGVLLVAAGGWQLRKRRDGLWLFAIPAALLTLFYALFPYPHRRYVLSILLFLCPLAGLGLAGLLDAMASRRRWAHARTVIYAVALAAMVVPMVAHVHRLQPWWGPRVERREVLDFYGDLRGYAGEDDLLLMEPTCRNLWDVLLSYSRFRLHLDPATLTPWLREGARCLYLEPLTPDAHYGGLASPIEVTMKQRLLAAYDLVTLPGPRLRIAQGEFQVQEVRLRSTHRIRQPLSNVMGRDVIVWVDLRDAAPDESASLGFDCGGAESRWTVRGGGLHALVLPGASNRAERLFFLADSETPLPAQPLLAHLRRGETIDLSLTQERSLSVHAWFQPPFRVPALPAQERFAASFTEGGRLCLPTVHGPAASLDVMLVVAPSPLRDDRVQVRFLTEGRELAADAVSLAAHRARMGFSLPLTPGAPTPCVDLRVEPADALGSHFRLTSVRLRLNPAAP